jgi:hypothetical protein
MRGCCALTRLCMFVCAAILSGHAQAQVPALQHAWDDLLGTGIPQVTPDPVLTPRQAPAPQRSESDFADHFFLEGRTDYWRYSTSFTGLPTTTSVINAPFTGIFNPNGIPYPGAFQPVANRVEGLSLVLAFLTIRRSRSLVTS